MGAPCEEFVFLSFMPTLLLSGVGGHDRKGNKLENVPS